MSSGNLARWSIVSIEQYLQEYENVHNDLQCSTHPELDWCLPSNKIACLECVTTEPHQHHLDTACTTQ